MKRIGVIVLLLGLLITSAYADNLWFAPEGVTATSGTYSDVIVVSWDSLSDSYYKVFRDSVYLGTVYSSTFYDTVNILPYGEVFEYRISACWLDNPYRDEVCSELSLPAEGYVVEDAPAYGPLPANDTSGSGCFIATAAYGSAWEPHVATLRRFRDACLLTNKPGRMLVEAYYRYSPPMAAFIAGNDILRFAARTGLAPLVGFSWLAVHCGMTVALLALAGLLAILAGVSCLVVSGVRGKERQGPAAA